MRRDAKTLIACVVSLLTASTTARLSAAPAAPPAAHDANKPNARRPHFLDPEHAPKGKEWTRLFNGKDLTGWHLRDPKATNSWSVVDRILHNKNGGEDLVSDQKFWNFEAYYEYRVPKKSNSGFYLRGRYEVQIFDSFGAQPSTQGNGAIYSLKAPSKNASRAADQWQSAYVKLEGKKVTVILNGEKIIDNFELTHATGGELDHDYGKPGPILLQGNHGAVDFRYIYVRPLKE